MLFARRWVVLLAWDVSVSRFCPPVRLLVLIGLLKMFWTSDAGRLNAIEVWLFLFVV